MDGEVAPYLSIHWIVRGDFSADLSPDLKVAELAVRKAVAAEGLHGPADMSIALTEDNEIRELNASYRGLDEVTDVLSFSLREGEDGFVAPPDGVQHLGDIIISLPQAQRQALESSHTLQQELALLAVHGALHLLGYDHATEKDACEMQRREQAALEG